MNYLTTKKAATLLQVSVRTAQQWVERGILEGWKTKGGHRRITHHSVLRVIDQRDEAARAKLQPGPLSLLIIEDDPSLLKLYRLQIARWPFEVTVYTAPNGYEGLIMVGEVLPSLLVCDLRVPGVNGFQIIRSLAGMPRFHKLKTVVVSGLPEPEITAHGGLPDDIVFLSKPIDFVRLQAIVHQAWAAQLVAGTEQTAAV
jgi:excisionase family DNA binding protein